LENDKNDKGGETKYGITKERARECGYKGSMKDFAMCLIVGMLSGTYSSIYIASACINFFCRKKKGEEMFVSKAKPAGVSV